MSKLFFIKRYFLPVAFFSFVINLLILSPTVYMLQLFSRVIGPRSEEALWMLSIMLIIALLVMGALEAIRSSILVSANNAMDAMVAPYLLNKMMEEAAAPEGSRYHYALKDLHTLRAFLTGHGLIQILDAVWMPFYFYIMWLMNPLMLVVLTVGAILMIMLTVANKFLTSSALREANEASQNAARFVDSTLKNAEVVNAMGMQSSITKRWASLNDRVIILQTRASNRAGVIAGGTKFIRLLVGAMGMGVGTYVVLHDQTFSVGLMIAGGIMFGKALGPLEYIITSWRSILDARSSYTRLDDFIKRFSQEQHYLMELPPPAGKLTLEHVMFGFRSNSKVTIRDVSFTLEAGEFLGIVGPSASGKSTLARLMVGVWKPLQGIVRIDDADMSSWPSERLGQYIGYLPQDIELFAGNIAENIARLEEPNSEMVIKAAKMAGLHEIILQMPNGYDTQIGEGGAILSGGQRQRIGFARALYGTPKILVLDEPNANLDTAGEAALINSLVQLKQEGITTILITHNPNYLTHAGKLLIMQNGSVAAFGPKDWVLAQAQQKGQQQAQVKEQPQAQVKELQQAQMQAQQVEEQQQAQVKA